MSNQSIRWEPESKRRDFAYRTGSGERGHLGGYFVRVFESLKYPDRSPWCFAVALDTTPPPPASARFRVVVRVTECASYEEARTRGTAALIAAVRAQITADANSTESGQ